MANKKQKKLLWREMKAIEILLENPFWSYYKIGQEMVRRGYTKDPRYLYKRQWALKWGPRPPVSEPWKRYMIKKYGYVPGRREEIRKHVFIPE
jgi:hypothetical protein